MEDYIEWGGIEKSLDDLFIWWATREPYVHTEDCEVGQIHCCDSPPKYNMGYGIQSPSPENMNFIYPDGTMVTMGVGDRVYYDGEGVYRLEKK